MKIRFEANGSDHERDLWSLYAWLRDDRTLRGQVDVDLDGQEAQPGEMGGAFDAVVAGVSASASLVSAGVAVGQLAASIRQWREARRPRSTVIVLSDGDAEDLKPIIIALSDAGQEE